MPLKIKLKELLLAGLTGLLLILSFPKWDFELLSWLAFIPLFFAIENKTPRQAFLLGWISALIFFLGSLNWVITTIVTYGHISWSVGFLAFLLMCFILAAYTGAFASAACYCISRLAIKRAILYPFLWTALEFARGHFFIPFPWVSLGYSQYRQVWLIQIADMTSVYGVSFIIVLVNTVLFEIVYLFYFHGKTEKASMVFSKIPLFATLFLLGLTLTYGQLKMMPPVHENSVRVSVIQGNIDQDKKWDERYRHETLGVYQTYSDEAALKKPDLILWPETSVPFLFEREPEYRDALSQSVRTRHTPLLFGSPALEPTPTGNIWRNSAYLLNSDGILMDRYDKINLVPFGEYVPFQSFLFFVNKITDGVGNFKGGTRETVFEIPGYRFGNLICFEVIFPELFRKFVNQGAAFMTTMTNDAWFGDSSAPYQHFSMVVFRAVENRTPIARAANTGISGFIDTRGNILLASPLFVPMALTYDLKYFNEITFYTRYGDVFGWTNLSASLLMICFAFWKRSPNAR
jgi:apolipoprotein N-acyltransferase